MKEHVERIASFEIVVQGFDGHPRADEDRSAAEDFRVAVYNSHFAGHGDQYSAGV